MIFKKLIQIIIISFLAEVHGETYQSSQPGNKHKEYSLDEVDTIGTDSYYISSNIPPTYHIQQYNDMPTGHSTQSAAHPDFMEKFLEVLGPGILPWPLILFLIPFAIPGLPLAVWMDRIHPEHEGSNGHHETTTPVSFTVTQEPPVMSQGKPHLFSLRNLQRHDISSDGDKSSSDKLPVVITRNDTNTTQS